MTYEYESDKARARALISQCIALRLLEGDSEHVRVLYDPQDGSEERWVSMTREAAAEDLVKQNAFDVLETAIDENKANALKLIDNCFEIGVLKEEDGVIYSPFFRYVEDEEVSWTCKEELLQDVLYEDPWRKPYCYNPRSEEYLKGWYNAYITTEKEFPELHEMLFSFSDADMLFSNGSDEHAVYYYNPDSNAGGQIVHCPFDNDMARRIINGEDWINVVAERTQYLSDINHISFFGTIEELIAKHAEGKYIGHDNLPDMLKKIV